MAKPVAAKAKEQSRTLSPYKAMTLIKHCMTKKRPVFMWGPPGIGKSDIISQIAKSQNRLVIDIRLLLMGPEDLKGIPYYNAAEGTMRWAPANELPMIVTEAMVNEQSDIVKMYTTALQYVKDTKVVADAESHVTKLESLTIKLANAESRLERYVGSYVLQNAILFLDEMNAATPSVQGAAFQLILNRKIGEYELPAGVDIVAAGNRETDRGVTFRMPTPLANRFVHLNLEHDFDDWQQWAVLNKVSADVVGFLTHHPHKLFNFDPKSPDKAWASPRTWFFTSELESDALSETDNTTIIAGTIGEGLAIEYMAHRRIAGKMPKAIDVLNGLVKRLDIEDVSARFSLVISMCYLLKELSDKALDKNEKEVTTEIFHEKFDNFLAFLLDVMQPEMVILGAQTAMKYYGIDFKHDMLDNFDRFFKDYGSYVLDK